MWLDYSRFKFCSLMTAPLFKMLSIDLTKQYTPWKVSEQPLLGFQSRSLVTDSDKMALLRAEQVLGFTEASLERANLYFCS